MQRYATHRHQREISGGGFFCYDIMKKEYFHNRKIFFKIHFICFITAKNMYKFSIFCCNFIEQNEIYIIK
jgi:hypothetical protein